MGAQAVHEVSGRIGPNSSFHRTPFGAPASSHVRARVTLDELSQAIASASPDAARQAAAEFLVLWKDDASTVEALKVQVERYIGDTWYSTDAVHTRIYRLWSEFVEKEIGHVRGMTMNERLIVFGLTNTHHAATQEQQHAFYASLLAEL